MSAATATPVEIEVTDGGAYIRVGAQEIDLSLTSPALDDDAAVRANLRDVETTLIALQAEIGRRLPEVIDALAELAQCEDCGGSGVIEEPEHTAHPGREHTCPACGGSGKPTPTTV